MRLKFYKDDDFVNYKKCSFFLGTPLCNWKCCIEQGLCTSVCQNQPWAKQETIEVDNFWLIDRYLGDKLEEAIVIGGLEPLDDFEDVIEFIREFRKYSDDDVVIYTGYYPEEIPEKLNELRKIYNITVKFGRYIPNDEKVYDPILGVTLASKNQFAKKIS